MWLDGHEKAVLCLQQKRLTWKGMTHATLLLSERPVQPHLRKLSPVPVGVTCLDFFDKGDFYVN